MRWRSPCCSVPASVWSSVELHRQQALPDLGSAVAVAAPAILMQDAARFACIASGRPVIAVISDGLWAAGSLTLFLLAASVTPAISPSTVVAGWSALAVLAAVVILLLARFWPDFRGTVELLRTTTADRIRYGATMAMGGSSSVLFLFVVAALIGSSAIAALRGSASLLSPLNILFASMALVLVPEFRRGPAATPAEYWRTMRRVAIVMSLIPSAVGALSFVVPDTWGEALLGSETAGPSRNRCSRSRPPSTSRSPAASPPAQSSRSRRTVVDCWRSRSHMR